MTIPVFTSCTAAAEAGYLISLPPIVNYRGWLIITDYRQHRVYLIARERRGKIVDADSPMGGIRTRLTGGIAFARGAHGGKIVQFRHVRLPRAAQPEEKLIKIFGRTSRVGVADELAHYATQAEWERARRELCRLIDIRIDGRANIDLIED